LTDRETKDVDEDEEAEVKTIREEEVREEGEREGGFDPPLKIPL